MIRAAALALPALLMAACAGGLKVLPRNELNEPVMHQAHHADVGIAAMPEFLVTRKEIGEGEWATRMTDFTVHFPIHPRIAFEPSLAPWASFSLLPVYWNLLLTGNQYADSASLKTGKLHLAFHGGLTGWRDSEQEGFLLTSEARLQGKYLLSQEWYLAPTLGVEFPSHRDLIQQARSAQVVAGWQLREEHSFSLGGRVTAFALGDGEYDRGIRELGYVDLEVEDGEIWTSVWAGNTNYIGPRHVFGSEIGFTWRAGERRDTQAYRIGAWYRYVIY